MNQLTRCCPAAAISWFATREILALRVTGSQIILPSWCSRWNVFTLPLATFASVRCVMWVILLCYLLLSSLCLSLFSSCIHSRAWQGCNKWFYALHSFSQVTLCIREKRRATRAMDDADAQERNTHLLHPPHPPFPPPPSSLKSTTIIQRETFHILSLTGSGVN